MRFIEYDTFPVASLTFRVRGAVRSVLLNPVVSPSTRAQTSPLKWIRRPLGSSELSVQGASLDARCRRYEVGPSQRIHSDLGNDTQPATDKLALRSSWARRSRCVGVRLTRLATRQDKAVFSEFHYLALDRAELGRHHLELAPQVPIAISTLSRQTV